MERLPQRPLQRTVINGGGWGGDDEAGELEISAKIKHLTAKALALASAPGRHFSLCRCQRPAGFIPSGNMTTNIEDDDAPPDLVDVSTLPALEKPRSSIPTAAAVDTPPQNRVPITLVTGMRS